MIKNYFWDLNQSDGEILDELYIFIADIYFSKRRSMWSIFLSIYKNRGQFFQ